MFEIFQDITGNKSNTQVIENKLLVFNKKHRLLKSEQNELMKKMSSCDSFKEAEVYFNKLYDSIVHPLWSNLSNKYIPPLSFEDLRDIFQEAWIKLLQNRKKYDGKSDVLNWIFTIKRNLIIDRLRQIKRYDNETISTDQLDEDHFEMINDLYEHAIDVTIENNEITHQLRNVLLKIEDNLIKDLLVRRIINNQKFELIAKETGLPLSTVFKKIKTGLNLIKPEVEKILYN